MIRWSAENLLGIRVLSSIIRIANRYWASNSQCTCAEKMVAHLEITA
jgi:hypothetical protein